MGKTLNYYEFYCEECNYCLDLSNRKGDAFKKWCSLHNRRVQEHDQGCSDFVLYEEGVDWDEFDDQ